MINNITTYSLDDLCIVPASVSPISSRSECDIYYENNKLPLFAAPMSCVISEDNFEYWNNLPINIIIPRSCSFDYRKKMYLEGHWVSVGLNEWDEFMKITRNKKCDTAHILLDVANGHMQKVVDCITWAREHYGYTYQDVEIMVGNIANPKTFRILSIAGANYIRCAIGAGNQCITTTQTGIHYPMATLIDECRNVYDELDSMWNHKEIKNRPAKIIADGGMKQYRDIITALALGAHYVMIGSLFGSMWESSAETVFINKDDEIIDLDIPSLENIQDNYPDIKIYKILYGMASRKAQKEIAEASNETCRNKTSEGKVSKTLCAGHIEKWLDNFSDYLRSAMSYTGNYTITEFNENTVLIPCPISERLRINK